MRTICFAVLGSPGSRAGYFRNAARYHACTFLYQRFVAELADSHELKSGVGG